MRLLKTVAIFLLVCLSMAILLPAGIIGIIFSFLGLKKAMSLMTYKISQGWSRALLFLSGSSVTVKGLENIPKEGGVCLVSNHGSVFDIVLNLAYVGRPFGFIAKKELLFVPFLNAWISILGGLFIDRKNPKKGLDTINQGVKRLRSGSGILIFPEGHRSRGQGLLPFRAGSFRLAAQSGVPIIPVAISNSYKFFEINYRLNPVPLRIEYCPPIRIDNLPPGNRKQFLADEVRRIIETALENAAGLPDPAAGST